MELNINYPSYQAMLENQPFISNQDFVPQIAKNIFSQEQISRIYEVIDATPESQTRVQPWAGHKVWDISFDKDIEDAIVRAAQAILGPVVHLSGDYSFARYSKDFGYQTKLFPHYDTRDKQRVTFDIQLRSTEPWGLWVEDNPIYYLEDNEALMFAGTQQIHWRDNKDMPQSAITDMIFCHLQYVEDTPLDAGQDGVLQARALYLMNQTGISNEEVII